MDLGMKIKMIRRIKSLTQLDMAEKIGISVVNYNRLENGANEFSLSRLRQVADIFGMRVSEVIDYGEETGKDKEIIELKKEILALKKSNNTLLRLSKFLYNNPFRERDFDTLMDLSSHMIDDDTPISIYDDTLKKHVLEDFEEDNKTEEERLEYNQKYMKKQAKEAKKKGI